METKHKTLAECKDEEAQKLGWNNFKDLELTLGSRVAENVFESARVKFNSDENRKKYEPKPFGYVLGADFYAYDSTLISESEKQKSTIVYADEPKQSDPVDFVNYLHEEGYEWGNKRYQLYRGGKFFWIKDIFTNYLTSKTK